MGEVVTEAAMEVVTEADTTPEAHIMAGVMPAARAITAEPLITPRRPTTALPLTVLGRLAKVSP